MSWNLGDNRNVFVKLKTKLGLYHLELKSNPKGSPEKIMLTPVETQHLPDNEQVGSKDEICCLKWTIYNGRRKVCINFQADTGKMNIFVYRYGNNTYLKDTEMDLTLTEYKNVLAQRVYFFGYIDFSTSGALYWIKQLFIIKRNSVKNGCSLSN